MKRTFVIGDIHGCHAPLHRLLDRIMPVRGKDRLVFLGDYVNRGPDSKQVIEELIEVKSSFPDTIFLKGNHEVMLLDYLAGREQELFCSVGGLATLESYGVGVGDSQQRPWFPEDHRRFLAGLLPCWSDEDFIFVHAGLEPGTHLSQQNPRWLFWAEREKFINTRFNLGKRIVFGHFAHREPLIMPDKIGIDCGAVYGGNLTCLVLPELRFIQEASRQHWQAPLEPPCQP